MVLLAAQLRACVELNFYINYFSWTGGCPFYKRSSIEFSVEFRELDYFIELFMLSGLGSKPFFLKRARMPDALRAFVWVSGN